jgi:hypothetical protein
MSKQRCVECRCTFEQRRARQRLCGRVACRRAHRNELERARRRKDLERSRAEERERQRRHRARRKQEPAARDRSLSLDRSDSEVVDMVEEIQKKLASLARRVTRMSLDRSAAQALDQTNERGGIRG